MNTNQIKITGNTTATSDVVRFNNGSTWIGDCPPNWGDVGYFEEWQPQPYFIYPYTTVSWIPQVCYKHEFRAEQKDGKFVVSVDLPGVCLADIKLSLDGNNLSLVAIRKDPAETISKTYFVLGDYWDLGSAQANLENGVLSVIFSEKKQSAKKEIKIQEKR